MEKSLKLLAFDLGASSGRAILGSFNGNTVELSEMHRFNNEPVYANGSLYWDTLRQLHEIKTGIIKSSIQNKDIAGIGVDTWGVDFGLIGSNGELLGNSLHYMDSMTDNIMEDAFKVLSAQKIYDKTGIQFMKFNTLFKLIAMKKKGIKALEYAQKLLFTPDLMNYFLTGEKTCEYSIASTSQMINAVDKDWDLELLKTFGIADELLCDIVDSGTVVGNLTSDNANELKSSRIPVIAVAGHDTASAVVSVPAREKDFVYISCGTWSLMGTELNHPVINEDTFKLQFTNEGGYGKTIRFLKNIIGLWIIQECVRDWNKQGESITFRDLDVLTVNAKPLVSIINPDDDMFASPGDMPSKVMKFCKETNQKVPEGKGDVARCIIESLALKYRHTLESIDNLKGKRTNVIHMVGGGIKDKLLCEFTACSTGINVVAGPIEATAIGNLMVQAMSLGYVANLGEAREVVGRSFPVEVYEPHSKEMWDEAYARFLNLI